MWTTVAYILGGTYLTFSFSIGALDGMKHYDSWKRGDPGVTYRTENRAVVAMANTIRTTYHVSRFVIPHVAVALGSCVLALPVLIMSKPKKKEDKS